MIGAVLYKFIEVHGNQIATYAAMLCVSACVGGCMSAPHHLLISEAMFMHNRLLTYHKFPTEPEILGNLER